MVERAKRKPVAQPVTVDDVRLMLDTPAAVFTFKLLAGERWRGVPGWADYQISSLGRVASKRPIGRPGKNQKPSVWRLMTPWTWEQDGYPHIDLYDRTRTDKKIVQFAIHTLILLAFVGPPAKGHEARHLDDIRSNSILSNLAWGTRSQNLHDSVRNGHHGGAKTSAKLKGRPRSPEVIAKFKAAWAHRKLRGWVFSEEARQKISKASQGRKQTPEHINKRVLGTKRARQAKVRQCSA